MRPRLSRETMIETALRLLDEVGLEGLTVRRLAAEFGVQSPALYWHVRTKQQLLDGMADAIILGAGTGPPRDGESWQEWLGRRARAYRDSLLAHRDGARIVCTAAQPSPATVRMFEQEVAGMVGRGFTPVLALRTITSVAHYVNGFALQAQGGRSSAAPADLLDGGMSAPLAAALAEGGDPFGEEAFEHGLRALIDGTAVALHDAGKQ
ncbi:TetR/AcrR family transcriptional regulator C-terminal domain-containing protein [Nonomuraea guangzhouensis]|uniref:TetR/AcrR family transcriptional regulator C-terminal domain-containing protein n=1 Tax=Nonomuraea guangzhouensis TaxID=1291555 RepID=A0ABW4GSE4_9ACTN|nr:TetR/AcrR family transcriptional regulator C-terminal domain-containing protein [Nonomuraea guangzhouensis]